MKHMKPALAAFCSLTLFAAGALAQPDPSMTEQYVFTLIWSRPDRKATAKAEGERIQGAHMAHIQSMAKQGALVAAGPIVSPNARLRGIFVFRVPLDQAKELANADPTVKEGLIEMESHPWYSYKGIGEPYKAWRAANPEAKDKMVANQLVVLRKGPNWDLGSASEKQAWRKEHLARIEEMRQAGKILVAGPFMDNSDIRGVLVYATTADEAKAHIEEDPFVKSGFMKMEIYSWLTAEGTFPPAPSK